MSKTQDLTPNLLFSTLLGFSPPSIFGALLITIKNKYGFLACTERGQVLPFATVKGKEWSERGHRKGSQKAERGQVLPFAPVKGKEQNARPDP